MHRPGVIEGNNVCDILLDTGCSRSLMRQELVSEEKLLEGESVELHCAHGDTVLYPVAELTETRYSTLWQSSRRHGTLPCGRAHGDTVLYPVAELMETRYSTLWQSSRRHSTLPCGRAHGDTVLYPVAELTETRYSTLWQS